MIRPSDFRIRELEPGDFETFDDKSHLSLEITKLSGFRARMLEIYSREGEGDDTQVRLSTSLVSTAASYTLAT